MKLLCINDKFIKIPGYTYIGDGLREGEIYETIGEPFLQSPYDPCLSYYIKGLGTKLVCRFTKVLDQSETQSISYSKEDLKKAIDEENYELAVIIHKELSPES